MTAEIPTGANLNKPLVFLVDDDDNILSSLKVILIREYRVLTANNSTKAVVAIRTAHPDVVVLDIRMPEHDGFWVFSEIRKFDAHVPIIFNSAYQDVMSGSDAADIYKPFGYLPKTGNLGDFLDIMRRASKAAGYPKPQT